MIQQFLVYIILVALLATFIDLLLKKIQVVKWVRENGNAFFSDMFNCDFCFSWWTCVLVCCVMAIITGNYQYLFIPPFATPITRILQS